MPAFRCDIEVAQAVRAEQPFVAHRNHEIGLDPLDIELRGPKRLTCVNYERSANPPDSLSDSFQIELAPIRPVTFRHGHGARIFIHRCLPCFGPTPSVQPLYRSHS